jgi:sugar-specific transcriptional regulator TrmB
MEVNLYEILLPLGDVPMAAIIKATGRHPQVVYRLVDQLASHGLAQISTKRHRKYVRAEDPKIFLQSQQEKIDRLHASLPELLALRHKPQEAAVRIERGPEAIRSLRLRAFEELKEGDTYYILSASGTRFYDSMGDAYAITEQKRITRGIRKKMLAFDSQRSTLDRNETMRTGVQIRFLPEHFAVPSSTNIYNNITAIQIWSKDPIVIVIESADVAASYKNYFEVLWKHGKK